MKNIILGFIAGVIIASSVSVLAVSYHRDIRPLNEAVFNLTDRVEKLEKIANQQPAGQDLK